MAEQDNYRVRVYAPVGIRDVTAHGIGLVKETCTRKDETRFEMKRELSGKVTFECTDFEYFYQFSVSDRRYDQVKAVISILCNGVWIEKWVTIIEVRKGTFDYERKTFECSFSFASTNTEYESRKSDEFNLLEIVSTRETTTPQYAASVVYTNGVSVYRALFGMFREIFTVTSIKSDFFGWNPDDPFYVIGHSDLLHNQALFHKSDIVKASSSGYSEASILNTTPEAFINNLCTLYNLQWTLDAAGNFRIEHVSWYALGSGLDLTQSQYTKSLKGSKQFSYDEPKIFRLEKFTNPNSMNIDFVGVPIQYNNDFIKNLKTDVDSKETSEDTLERKVDWITDIDAVYGQIGIPIAGTPNRDQELDGIVLLALDASGNIQKVPGILETTPTDRNNNVNAWAILQDDYWRDKRLFPSGLMNNVQTTFNSIQRIKKRKTLTIPFCCDETIDVEGIVDTEYGDAVIEKITFDPYRGTAEMDLSYEDLDSIALLAPVAVDDVYITDISTTVDTAASARPTLIANDTGASFAYPETKLSLLGGTVNILSTGHFVYVPPVGVSGSDVFEYVALTTTGRLDIGEAKIIIKVGTVFVTIVNYDYTSTIPGGGPTTYVYSRRIEFFADPLLLTPLDLTGYGITVFYSGTNNAVPFSGSFLATGFGNDIFFASYSAAHSVSTSITPNAAYTIV